MVRLEGEDALVVDVRRHPDERVARGAFDRQDPPRRVGSFRVVHQVNQPYPIVGPQIRPDARIARGPTDSHDPEGPGRDGSCGQPPEDAARHVGDLESQFRSGNEIDARRARRLVLAVQ